MSERDDHLIVGSGINALVCAALLAKSGARVRVLERNERIGGCIRTEECTLPGFRHDVFSQWYPLFLLSPGYAELRADLEREGLEFAHTARPTASLLPDNSGFVMRTSRADNVAAMDALADGDGVRYAEAMAFVEANAELTFAALGEELWRFKFFKTLAKTVYRQGPRAFAGNVAEFMRSARAWLTQDFTAPAVQACIAPWVLHTGLSPDSAFSAHMAKVICFSLEAVGTPVVKGGSDRLLTAFQAVIERYGGAIETGCDIERVRTEGHRAVGVDDAAGRRWDAANVICSMTPQQLYSRLLRDEPLPDPIHAGVRKFRHGLSDMQIHLALDAPPKWLNPAMNDVAMVHVTPGINGISRAVNEATRGLLPHTATIVVGQPCVLDPSRAPHGKSILWIQCQELPALVQGDAGSGIEISSDGRWTEAMREAYADRITQRLARHISNLPEITLGRRVFSPADLAAANINLVGGDPYGGDCHLDQFLFARPLPGCKNHETPIKGLYHIGASTHPGPGLGGGSGYALAAALR